MLIDHHVSHGMPTGGILRAATLALLLLALASQRGQAQPAPPPVAPPVPLWQQWFDALNQGDVAGVRALMVTDGAAPAGEATDGLSHCAGGCTGMPAIEAALDELVADGYWGRIDPGSVLVADTTVTFDVVEVSGGPLEYDVRSSQWTMELDGPLIAPACPAVCLRSPTDRAAHLTTPPAVLTPASSPAPTMPPASASRVRPTVPVLAPVPEAGGGGADATPARWVVAGLVAGLGIIATSIGRDLWRHRRRTPAARP